MKNKKIIFGIFLTIIVVILLTGVFAGTCFNCLKKGTPFESGSTCVSKASECDFDVSTLYYGWETACSCGSSKIGDIFLFAIWIV